MYIVHGNLNAVQSVKFFLPDISQLCRQLKGKTREILEEIFRRRCVRLDLKAQKHINLEKF
jgi:hypothetical protein